MVEEHKGDEPPAQTPPPVSLRAAIAAKKRRVSSVDEFGVRPSSHSLSHAHSHAHSHEHVGVDVDDDEHAPPHASPSLKGARAHNSTSSTSSLRDAIRTGQTRNPVHGALGHGHGHASSAEDATRDRADSKMDVWAASLPPVEGSPVLFGSYSGCTIKKVVNADDHVVLVRVPGLGDREAKRGEWHYRDVAKAIQKARGTERSTPAFLDRKRSEPPLLSA